jgi:hypothetical protein
MDNSVGQVISGLTQYITNQQDSGYSVAAIGATKLLTDFLDLEYNSAQETVNQCVMAIAHSNDRKSNNQTMEVRVSTERDLALLLEIQYAVKQQNWGVVKALLL